MKFYGCGSVWDASKGRVLCRFENNGELETEDEYIIERLIAFEYRHENAEPYIICDKEPEEHLFVIEGSLPDAMAEEVKNVIKNERTKTVSNNGASTRKSNRRAKNN